VCVCGGGVRYGAVWRFVLRLDESRGCPRNIDPKRRMQNGGSSGGGKGGCQKCVPRSMARPVIIREYPQHRGEIFRPWSRDSDCAIAHPYRARRRARRLPQGIDPRMRAEEVVCIPPHLNTRSDTIPENPHERGRDGRG
jgi:hypothetical protein